MANTLSADLVVDVVRDRVLTVLGSKLAFLSAYSTDFTADTIAPKSVVQVAKATAGATAQTDPSNYESGDTTLSNIAVTPSELSVSFHLTSAQLQQGFRLQKLIDINLRQLAYKIADTALAPVTGAAALTVAAADFGTDDLVTLYAAGKDLDMKHLVLDGSYVARILPTDRNSFALGESGAYGFDRILENNRWTGAQANVTGFLCDPQAIAVASGLPTMDDGVANDMQSNDIVTIDSLGLSVRFSRWISRATRAPWASFNVMFGAASGDSSRLKIIKSA
jgi:hypothetical protein